MSILSKRLNEEREYLALNNMKLGFVQHVVIKETNEELLYTLAHHRCELRRPQRQRVRLKNLYKLLPSSAIEKY